MLPRRSVARRVALMALYEAESHPELAKHPDRLILRLKSKPAANYAKKIVVGVLHSKKRLDALIAPTTHHWDWQRVGLVERIILRIAAWELLHSSDVPTATIIDEAVEMAKKFANPDAGTFVNGVLATLHKSLRPKQNPTQPQQSEPTEI